MIEGITGHFILLMAPTGSGKGELERHIFARFPTIRFSVSCTTRPPRPGEQDGREYYFLTRDQFETKIARGEFLEWAEFGHNLYGTLKSEVLDRLRSGEVLLHEIELQGVEALQAVIPKEHLTVIYVEAGGWEILRARALKRAPIDETELEKRYQRYLAESASKPLADHIIYNYDGDLEQAKLAIEEIVADIFKRIKP